MKQVFAIIVLLLGILPIRAQKDASARKVLDKVASVFTQKNGVQASFQTEHFVNGSVQGSVSGQMTIKGNKFQMTTPDMLTWYNGETQWSYVKANEEVNISTPTPEEQESMNPYTFINLYKKGYNYTLKDSKLRGKPCHEITLKAQSKNKKIQTVILDIDASDYTLLCIRMQQEDHTWIRITIHQFASNQTFKDDDFEFQAKDYPQAEIIDLR